ncbi:hypothetical protein STRNTR1_0254 [Stenotrophomonas maltophilia]|nr:hypothetical protein STRNTR1_0254 [Stenotrophomonas maltophilia]
MQPRQFYDCLINHGLATSWIVPLQVAGRVVYDVNDVTDYFKQP